MQNAKSLSVIASIFKLKAAILDWSVDIEDVDNVL